MDPRPRKHQAIILRLIRRSLQCLGLAILAQAIILVCIAYFNRVPSLGIQINPYVGKATVNDQLHLATSTSGLGIVFYDDVYVESRFTKDQGSELEFNTITDGSSKVWPTHVLARFVVPYQPPPGLREQTN